MDSPVTSPKLALYLSQQGDSVEIKNFYDKNASTLPVQVEAAKCKTQEQVLEFLKGLQESKMKNNMTFHHTSFMFGDKKHCSTVRPNHTCDLAEQILFVSSRIESNKSWAGYVINPYRA
jgi:hypothetical protein